MKKKKILLQGYIGYKNFGDDLLFDNAINNFEKNNNIELSVVISGSNIDYRYLKKIYPTLKIYKFKKRTPILFYLKFSKIYFIGGGVFFDYRKQINSIVFFKSFLLNLIRFNIPRIFGTKYGGIGIGIGPYFCQRSIILHRQILKKMSFLGVRDEKSYSITQQMKIKRVFLSEDLSIQYFTSSEEKDVDKNDSILICPRSYKHKPEYESHIKELYKFTKYLEEKNYSVKWVLLQRESSPEINYYLRKVDYITWEPNQYSIQEFLELFNRSKLIISSRMHAIYIAGITKTPFIAIELHPKLRYSSSLFYREPIVLSPFFNNKDIIDSFSKIFEFEMDHRELKKQKIKLEILSKKFHDWLIS